MITSELRGEITKDENKQIRIKFAEIGRAHGLPKIDKQFVKIPSFQLIIDTTNIPHYGVAKFLKNLLNPLTQNKYTVKDSFEAFNMIHKFRNNFLIKAIVNFLLNHHYLQISL